MQVVEKVLLRATASIGVQHDRTYGASLCRRHFWWAGAGSTDMAGYSAGCRLEWEVQSDGNLVGSTASGGRISRRSP
jgi:hypothetical protein